MKKMHTREFMRKYLPSCDFQKLARKYKLNLNETRAQLIDQIAANPEFGIAELNWAISLSRMKTICRELNLRVTGSKDELWAQIVETLSLEHRKEDKPPQLQIPTASIREFMLKYLTKDYLKEIVSEYPIKQTGRKNELIDRLLEDPEFELHDVYHLNCQIKAQTITKIQ
ncbi:MAG: SAP domain-containing protein [Candidatus Hodarchaeales archaeon]